MHRSADKVVIDSSVIFAALFRGSDAAVNALSGRQLVTSAVSHAELLHRGMQSGTQLEYVSAVLDRLSICVFAVHTSQAIAAASLRQLGGGISLQPEAWYCFALAQSLECPVVTSDPAWRELRVGVPIEFVESRDRGMSTEVITRRRGVIVAAPLEGLPPAIIERAGAAARLAWEEVFEAETPNPGTRKAYRHAVRVFLAWCEACGVELVNITPGMVGHYFRAHTGSPATKQQHLAAVRKLFDKLVLRHAIIFNPALSVRTERYQVIEGKTPEIAVAQAEKLLASIDASSVVGLRDRAVIAVLIFTAARVGAVSKLRLKHFEHDGSQWTLRFGEKGGKSREIPVRHDLQGFILAYRAAANLEDEAKECPLFRTSLGRTGRLTGNRMTGIDICRMVKRRLKDAGLPSRLSPHFFRVMTITDLLEHGLEIDEVQYLAGHADSRTTALYDRRKKRVTRNIVERISVRTGEGDDQP